MVVKPVGAQPPPSSAVTINMLLPGLTVLLLLSCCAEYGLAQCTVGTAPSPALKPLDNDAGSYMYGNPFVFQYTSTHLVLAYSSNFLSCVPLHIALDAFCTVTVVQATS